MGFGLGPVGSGDRDRGRGAFNVVGAWYSPRGSVGRTWSLELLQLLVLLARVELESLVSLCGILRTEMEMEVRGGGWEEGRIEGWYG